MKLMSLHKPGTLCLASWLKKQGISYDLQKYYRRAGWLAPFGRGAYKRPGDHVEWEGGVYALKEQAGLQVHVGGLTALTKQGSNQYMRFGEETAFLFTPLKVKFPAWFSTHDWGARIEHVKTGFLPEELGIGDVIKMGLASPSSPFNLKISGPERAILECLYLAPKFHSLEEIYEILEGLVNLRPKVVQGLLEDCRSVKVKRLFLYMADKASHKWLKYVETGGISLGEGDRVIVPNGTYVAKYKISIPKELESG
ncbi:hypothetical protein FKG94_04250 [Exilibacterium tricleocarpae]|uniref:Transcriptional regulator AbiEi antitoxin N-terminal domain-containing protein n=1 Tax=Exilibacterium tricleocarpae TaxID=2591008 RepID=A0A545U5J4_9GAMM|nr:hypothetical protein FKG94_04250 [Exilibacterium tricleocarpae]